jgi:hypothetical protein
MYIILQVYIYMFVCIVRYNDYACISGNQTWTYRLPQSKVIMYSFYLAYCYRVKQNKILAVRWV